jgi:hypothetical protein
MVGEEGDGFGSTRTGGPIREDGRFTVEALPPGAYTLSVITGPQDDPETESTSVPVTIASENLEGLALVTSPPAVVSGRVLFDPAPDDPEVRPNKFPLALQYRSRGAVSVPFGGTATRPADDGTFEMRMHGDGRADPQQADQWPGGWILDSVLVGGVDVSASGIELRAGEAVRDVQIVLTKHGATLMGMVTDARGAAAPHGFVVVLPDQPDSASRMGAFTTEADDNGRFTLTPMRSGAYVAAAVKEPESFDPQMLETLRPSAVPFQIARGEKKVLNLRLVER